MVQWVLEVLGRVKELEVTHLGQYNTDIWTHEISSPKPGNLSLFWPATHTRKICLTWSHYVSLIRIKLLELFGERFGMNRIYDKPKTCKLWTYYNLFLLILMLIVRSMSGSVIYILILLLSKLSWHVQLPSKYRKFLALRSTLSPLKMTWRTARDITEMNWNG